jgi:hypothetical protein
MPKKEILDRLPRKEILERIPRKEIVDRIQKYVRPFRITKGEDFRLKDFDPGDTCGLELDKGEGAELRELGVAWLAEEQDMLYAQDRWSLLLIFQAMDAAGKDSTIKHVMSGVNPQGCQVFSVKQPSSEELDHDFMWRYLRHLPERGRIGIFNRSSGSPTSRAFRGLCLPTRDENSEVLPSRIAQGAEEALHGAPRRAGEELDSRHPT